MAKDLDDILLELKKDIYRTVSNKVDKEIKDVYREEVEYMYSEYEPKSYERRYDNRGFLDELNWNEDIEILNSGIEYTLTNETDVARSSPYRLDVIIEDGIGYNWKEKPGKRPVYERTMERIESEQVVENVLSSVLNKLGWDVK